MRKYPDLRQNSIQIERVSSPFGQVVLYKGMVLSSEQLSEDLVVKTHWLEFKPVFETFIEAEVNRRLEALPNGLFYMDNLQTDLPNSFLDSALQTVTTHQDLAGAFKHPFPRISL